MFDRPQPDLYFSQDHLAFRAVLRSFVDREITPNIAAWEDAGRLPRSLYKKAGDLGVMGALYPEEVGGIGGDMFFHVVVSEEISRCGAGGVAASLGSHSIGTPPLVKLGSDALKQQYAVPVIAGDMISALAVTEPGGGSDVAALRTRAVRDGDHYVISGEKTFITSGMQADVFTVAVRTDPDQKGAGGISFILVPGDTPGLSRTPLAKMGWLASDTAHLVFDQCRVPVDNVIGAEGEGFKAAMMNFNNERLTIAIQAYSMAEVCYREALEWAQQRHAFGGPISQQQVIRHKLVDMAARIDAARSLTYDIIWRYQNKMDPLNVHVARTSMAKVTATNAMKFCADEAVQILGGMGFMRGTASERIYREVKVLTIGGGTDEVMKNLAASQLGI
ncbi:acyl-CoA dehydrogenase [Thalassovita litoralis]|jgi:acyl-CoA dehydrogenase|uniref:Acyl-CoA dehydrogenase n=1 Tax=Thalassovita litoralis TaxID=1010611 RepID=A0A521C527_9RHOB|nr:acyl-CoA dehydrogenase family protein [Thalassovita litoralis]SMO54617.1 acyl-CoA dehydrogenase [Thalassovita litoralis]